VRIAIVSDIHGNRTAFEAVLADLRETSPDLILQDGDLPHGGASPAEMVDRVRDLGWPGVVGNTDEMLWDPATLTDFAKAAPLMQALLPLIEEMAAWTREALGEARMAWLRGLPRVQIHAGIALVHASPMSTWRSPAHTASDAELETVYGPLGQAVVVYGHTHQAYVRKVSVGMSGGGMTVANSDSVSMSLDGDRRAAYLLLDDLNPVIRRVAYDVEREITALRDCGFPHAGWIEKTLRSGRPEMP
jgi:predicted phosphodiesterase